MTLNFEPAQSAVDIGFWAELGDHKLDTLKLDEGPVPCTFHFTSSQYAQLPGFLTASSGIHGPARPSPPGTFASQAAVHVVNTQNQVIDDGRKTAVEAAADGLWAAITSGAAEAEPGLLAPSVLRAHCDLKHYKYTYWFAMPSLQPREPFCLAAPTVSLRRACQEAGVGLDQILGACDGFLREHGHFAFLLEAAPEAAAGAPVSGDASPSTSAAASLRAQCHPLTAAKEVIDRGVQQNTAWFLALADSSSAFERAGWTARALLVLAAARWKLPCLRLLCLRQRAGRCAADDSAVFEVRLPSVDAAGPRPPVAPGWEANSRGRPGPRQAHLGAAMDPTRLAVSAVELNLGLMRWRAAPDLDVRALSELRCLLLGAGTLGCSVARTLLGWGVRRLTLVDGSRVSFSNPVRQSLYVFDDCLAGGKPKAAAAAEALKKIFPSVQAQGIDMMVPMPGHVNSSLEKEQAERDAARLQGLIEEHDVIYLLMDTRESRWLPSVLGAAAGKLVVNAALGFDGYLVMRHGGTAGPQSARLGCYFCNDVVAPIDSTTGLSMDQQCTVARPGLSAIAGALAVEMTMATISHPLAAEAPAGPESDAATGPLGCPPHMLRGQLTGFSQVAMRGNASAFCTACSPAVLEAFKNQGLAFILESLMNPKSLEDLTGLTQLHLESEEALAPEESDDGSSAAGGPGAGSDDDDWHEL